ncbi:MAG: twin-arginine translocase TatA/TatE family subunit [Bacteroidetes bacterium]|nr:twin-arginine translocase TatA/TatE family subunit [Bacteroidota bacterium]
MNLFILLGMIGPWQIVLIVAIVLLLFGGKKIPELMKGIGKGAREFKKGLSGEDEEKDKDSGTDTKKIEKP